MHNLSVQFDRQQCLFIRKASFPCWTKFGDKHEKISAVPPGHNWPPMGSLKFNISSRRSRNSTCILSSFLTWTGQSPCLITGFLQAGTIFTSIEKSWRTILNPHALEVPWISVVLNALSRQTGRPRSAVQAVVHLVPWHDNGVPKEKRKEGRKWRNSECKSEC